MWGATVYNSFGMTEGAMISVERDGMDGMVAFSDLYYLEVIDSATGKPVPEGKEGMLVMTPIWSNTITPFVRWLTGDIVTLKSQPRTDDPFSVFPLLKHALRTEGFFKIRGVNINHGDLEDFMFTERAVTDFKAEAVTRDDRDHLCLMIEIARGAERAQVAADAHRGGQAQIRDRRRDRGAGARHARRRNSRRASKRRASSTAATPAERAFTAAFPRKERPWPVPSVAPITSAACCARARSRTPTRRSPRARSTRPASRRSRTRRSATPSRCRRRPGSTP